MDARQEQGVVVKERLLRVKGMADKNQSNLLLVITRNPELGKVKTRLAEGIGEQNALEVYTFLLKHTNEVITSINAQKRVLYSEQVIEGDLWSAPNSEKKIQSEGDLGHKMKKAFEQGFNDGYEKVVIIGSDLYDLEAKDIEEAFRQMDEHDVVIGPAQDGGYYLLGFKKIPQGIFDNKEWGTDTVLKATLKDLEQLNYILLKEKNDIDTIEDLEDIPAFEKYIKNK